MFLFRNSTYTETYPAGQVTLPVGSPLYVGVFVDERDTNFAAVLKDCYATHSSNPDDPVRYSLIQNKYVSISSRVAKGWEISETFHGNYGKIWELFWN